MAINPMTTSTCMDAVNLDSSDNFGGTLDANVNVSHLRIVKPRVAGKLEAEPRFGNIKSRRGKPVGAEVLAKRWNID